MARSNGALTNGGWPPQRAPNTEPDPRAPHQGMYPQQQQRPPQQGGYPPQQQARPQQPAPGGMYPPAGYPEQQSAPPAYDPQPAYHYPQQSQPVTAPPRPRQGHPGGHNGMETTQPPQQQGYGSYAQPQQQPQPGYGAPRQAPAQPNYAPTPNTQPRRQQVPPPRQPNPAFRQPNGAPDYGARPQAEPRTAPPRYDQWPPAQAPAPAPSPQTAQNGYGMQQDVSGYDLGSYMPAGHQADGLPHDLSQVDPLQQHAAWLHPAHGDYGDAAIEQGFDQGFEQTFQAGDLAYEQGHAGALEPTYNQDEAAEYEVEEPKRGSWVLRIAGAVVVAIGLGYGLAQGYKMVAGSSADGETPVVHSDAAPARTKPSDPGGKEFAHADSKIMGRLGDGSEEPSSSADSSDGGTRRVQTVQVGRDGSIVPPEAPVENASSSSVNVPGVTVIDGFGGSSYGGSVVTTAPEPPSEPRQTASTSKPIVVNPPSPPTPSAKPEVIAKVTPTSTKTTTAKPAAKKKPVTTAAVDTSAGSGADGYVVVLASIPASSASRLDALKKFADMQQQYGSVLMNKTPDVREANLGDRGTYHRLLVGPPSSRSQANQLCSQLKSAGYKDCWVMAY